MRLEQIAQDTVQIIERGNYQTPAGHLVDLSADLLECVNTTQCYEPEELVALRDQLLASPAEFSEMGFEVKNETTLQSSARLAASLAHDRIGVLNFASAKNPGGGFLRGAQAQEESLARSSGLYQSLLKCTSYYAYHRAHRSALYSDRIIYSPHCPVFRADDGTLLERPYLVDFMTSPAPNAGVIYRNEPANVPKIASVLRERTAKILTAAAKQRCEVLILGAWGCGVFRNDPVVVAETFWEQLGPEGPFWKRFQKVVFAVWDTSREQRIYQPFQERFGA